MNAPTPEFDPSQMRRIRSSFARVVSSVINEPCIDLTDVARTTLDNIRSTFDEVPDSTMVALTLLDEVFLPGEIEAAIRVRLMINAVVGGQPPIEDALSLVTLFVPLLDNFKPGRDIA